MPTEILLRGTTADFLEEVNIVATENLILEIESLIADSPEKHPTSEK